MCGVATTVVEADLTELAKHRQTVGRGLRAVIDRGHPMTMKVDEPSHPTWRSTIAPGLAARHAQRKRDVS